MTKYDFFDGRNLTGPKKAISQVHLLPAEEPNFKWRVRVDLRCALDAPLNRTTQQGLPSCYAGNLLITLIVISRVWLVTLRAHRPRRIQQDHVCPS
jgi:hypothetical protein